MRNYFFSFVAGAAFLVTVLFGSVSYARAEAIEAEGDENITSLTAEDMQDIGMSREEAREFSSDMANEKSSAAMAGYGPKTIKICFRGHTIIIPVRLLPWFLRHGATVGKCPKRIEICYKKETLNVSAFQLPWYLWHGAKLGKCPPPPKKKWSKNYEPSGGSSYSWNSGGFPQFSWNR